MLAVAGEDVRHVGVSGMEPARGGGCFPGGVSHRRYGGLTGTHFYLKSHQHNL